MIDRITLGAPPGLENILRVDYRVAVAPGVIGALQAPTHRIFKASVRRSASLSRQATEDKRQLRLRDSPPSSLG
ncbi:hypothetical protein BDV10DRAFT_70968 [Aspergillus recurvatus]